MIGIKYVTLLEKIVELIFTILLKRKRAKLVPTTPSTDTDNIDHTTSVEYSIARNGVNNKR